MASIEKIGPRAWRVVWRDGGRGTKKHYSPRYPTKGEAEEYARQLDARETARRAPDGLALTGRELAERWRIHLRQQARVGPYIERAPDLVTAALGDGPLSQLRPDALRALRVGARRVVKAALRWGVRELGAAVPPLCLTMPTAAPARRPALDLMPDAVLARIQREADDIDASLGAIVHLVSSYGHRPESLAHLTAADLERAHLTLTVKGGDRIRHPILPATAKRLRALAGAKPTDRLLRNPHTGEPFPSGQAIAYVYRSALGRRNWKPEPGIYSLKRRAISHMLAEGLDAVTIASITGHRTPSVLLDRYGRTNDARQKEALDAIRPRPARGDTKGTRGRKRAKTGVRVSA